ncbi:MAG: hypothetical protein GY913_24850 [Proteobacteria bacterium]|nr:hypothetical protein [Pseudomonadota bacterium]MCP4920144.1 hypothetical protein [Pseudomonadota bacterium]
MTALLAALSTANAGNVYINGVNATGLTNFELQDVDVRLDADGDVYIDAPRYSIEVQAVPDPVAPITEPVTEPVADPVLETPEDPVPVAAPVTEPVGTVAPEIEAPAAISAPPEPLVAPETWWLVTEDNGSSGHVVEVFIAGTAVATVRSGDEQLILDVSPYLAPGDNIVNLSASPADMLGGGVLNVYLGPGSNDAGTLNLAAPQLTFTRRATDDPAGTAQQLTLVVP